MNDTEPHVRIFDTIFGQEPGIHLRGALAHRSTSEVIRPEGVGFGAMRRVLGKHSGRHALRTQLERLGYSVREERLGDALEMVKRVAKQKKEIDDDDLRSIFDRHSSLHWST